METNLTTKLYWVQKNRTRASRVRPVSALLARWVHSLSGSSSARASALARALAGHVDREFCDHCRVHVDDQGRISVVVDEPGLVFSMRARWFAVVQKVHRGMGWFRTGGDVWFCHGAWGESVSAESSATEAGERRAKSRGRAKSTRDHKE